MPQLITKYNSGPLGISEAADALLDPKSAFRYYLDFIQETEDDDYISTVVGAAGSTAAVVAGHGGQVQIVTHNGGAGDGAIMGSPNDFIVLDGGRIVYAEARISNDDVTNPWYFGLTADAPATTEWSTATITPSTVAILIGWDAGTDSLTGAVAGKSLQLSVRGTGTTEALVPLDFTIAANTFYRVGFVVQGWTVQAYVNGKKCGAPVRMNSTSTTPVGVQLSMVTPAASARNMLVDYIDVVATR